MALRSYVTRPETKRLEVGCRAQARFSKWYMGLEVLRLKMLE